jgi:demethylspheroidene O-methyltransferase
VARARAAGLFDLTAGFVYSQILLTLVELDILQMLKFGTQTRDALAIHAALSADSALRLLKGAAALELVEMLPDGRVALGAMGAALLANPGAMAMIRHHRLFYSDLADPAGLLRGQTNPSLQRFWAYGSAAGGEHADQARVAEYSALMSVSQDLIAESVLDAVALPRSGALLDIGGGEGVFLAAALRRHPRLTGMLFDLPAVAVRAGSRLARFGGRATAISGDVFADPLPAGASCASLIRVLHDHDDAHALIILQRARAALPPGGLLVVAETLSGVRGAERVADAYFGFYLAAMGSGRARTPDEVGAMLGAAGFSKIRTRPTPLPMIVSVLVAQADGTTVTET